MKETAIYKHHHGEEYRVEVLKKEETQLFVRFTEEDAKHLGLQREIWLPRSYFKKVKEI